MRLFQIVGLTLCLGAAAFGSACSSQDGDSAATTGSSAQGCFLAFNPQFADFRTWTQNHFTSTEDLGVVTHVSGARTEYVNRLPQGGDAEFAVGTIIVKEIESADPANHHIFAMVKRGCDFNSSGASGWEWFELTESSGKPSILWRGVGAPAGEKYGGDATGGCNTCHAGACKANDSVCSPRLVLSNGDGGR
jgi:hypothetical protein